MEFIGRVDILKKLIRASEDNLFTNSCIEFLLKFLPVRVAKLHFLKKESGKMDPRFGLNNLAKLVSFVK